MNSYRIGSPDLTAIDLQRFHEDYLIEEKTIFAKEDQTIYSLMIGQNCDFDMDDFDLNESTTEYEKKIVYIKPYPVSNGAGQDNNNPDSLERPLIDEGFKIGIVTGLMLGVISFAAHEITRRINSI